MLRARMYEAELQRREAASQAALADAKSDIGWGHQIRSYVLAAVPDGEGPAHRGGDLRHPGRAGR